MERSIPLPGPEPQRNYYRHATQPFPQEIPWLDCCADKTLLVLPRAVHLYAQILNKMILHTRMQISWSKKVFFGRGFIISHTPKHGPFSSPVQSRVQVLYRPPFRRYCLFFQTISAPGQYITSPGNIFHIALGQQYIPYCPAVGAVWNILSWRCL